MAKNREQVLLFENIDELSSFAEHWKDMPEFTQNDQMPVHQIIISFQDMSDIKKFSELLNQKCTYKTKSAWFPAKKRPSPADYVYINESMNSDKK